MSDIYRSSKANAFASPTVASKERLGIRGGNSKSPTAAGACTVDAGSVISRRSVSMISSTEDAEMFEQMSNATSVKVKKSKNRVRAAAASSTDGSTVSGTVDQLVGGLMRSFSPASSTRSGEKTFSFASDDGGEEEQQWQEPNKSNLDLRNNDNSFHVLASLLVEFFRAKVDEDEQTLTLLPEDRITVQRLLPDTARRAFIEAARYRLELTPLVATTPLQFLTQQCQELGLDNEDAALNPILVAIRLGEKPVSLSVPSPPSPRSQSRAKSTDYGISEMEEDNDADDDGGGDGDDDDNDDEYDENYADGRGGDDATSLESAMKVASSQDIADEMEADEKEENEPTVFDRTESVVDNEEEEEEDRLENSPRRDVEDNQWKAEEIVELSENDTDDELENRSSEVSGVKSGDDARDVGASLLAQNTEKPKATNENLVTLMSAAAGAFFSDIRAAVGSPTVDSTPPSMKPGEQERTQQHASQMGPAAAATAAPSATESQQKSLESSTPFVFNDTTSTNAPNNVSTGTERQPAYASVEALKTESVYVDFSKYEEMKVVDNQVKDQLLAELYEASAMLEQSETPETTRFWREHATSLMARMDALQAADAVYHNDFAENVENAETGVGADNIISNKPNDLLDGNRDIDVEVQNLAMKEVKPQEEAYKPVRPYSAEIDVPMVDVVAPADLPAGYHFEAEIEGQRFLATVPPGGVQQGETFTCYMRELDSVAIDIPVGYWKDGLCNFFKYGCCHPVVWHGLFCPLIGLGQIQQRTSLDFLGRPRFGDEGISNRVMMLVVVVFWAATNVGIFAACNLKWFNGMELSMADASAILLINVAMFGFVVFVTQSTRSSLREKFMIREERCFDLEDLCCATMCLSCTVCQMARHTANYDDYEAVCCSKTGLPDGVRVNQTSGKESDGYVV